MSRATRSKRPSRKMPDRSGPTTADIEKGLKDSVHSLYHWDPNHSTPEDTAAEWASALRWNRLARRRGRSIDPFPFWISGELPEETIKRSLIFGHPRWLKEVQQYSSKCPRHYQEDLWRFLLFFDNLRQPLARTLNRAVGVLPFTSLPALYEWAEKNRAKRTERLSNSSKDLMFLSQDFGDAGPRPTKKRRRATRASTECDDTSFEETLDTDIDTDVTSADGFEDTIDEDTLGRFSNTPGHASQSTRHSSVSATNDRYKIEAPQHADDTTIEGPALVLEDSDRDHEQQTCLSRQLESADAWCIEDRREQRTTREHLETVALDGTGRNSEPLESLDSGGLHQESLVMASGSMMWRRPTDVDDRPGSSGPVSRNDACVEVAEELAHYSDPQFFRCQSAALPRTRLGEQSAEQELMVAEQRLLECKNRYEDMRRLRIWQEKCDSEGPLLVEQVGELQREHEEVRVALGNLRARATGRSQFLQQLSFHTMVTDEGRMAERMKSLCEEEKKDNREGGKLQQDLQNCGQQISKVVDRVRALRSAPKRSQ